MDGVLCVFDVSVAIATLVFIITTTTVTITTNTTSFTITTTTMITTVSNESSTFANHIKLRTEQRQKKPSLYAYLLNLPQAKEFPPPPEHVQTALLCARVKEHSQVHGQPQGRLPPEVLWGD